MRNYVGTYADTPLVRVLMKTMEEQKLSPRALGLKAGMSGDVVRNLIRGKSASPHESTVRALAVALGVSVAFLLGDEEHVGKPRRSAAPMPDEHVPFRCPHHSAEAQPGEEGYTTVRPPSFATIPVHALAWPPGVVASGNLRETKQTTSWAMPPYEILSLGHDPEDTILLTVSGEGWSSIAEPGDKLLVDVAQKRAAPGRWVVWDGWRHSAIALEVEGRYQLSLDGEKVDPTSLIICGQIIRRWCY